MARIKLLTLDETSGAERERYEELAGRNAVTNMKKGLLQDAATYDAYMAWYTSWNRLVEVIGEKDATIYAHAISTTNSCMLCSLFLSATCRPWGWIQTGWSLTKRKTCWWSWASRSSRIPLRCLTSCSPS